MACLQKEKEKTGNHLELPMIIKDCDSLPQALLSCTSKGIRVVKHAMWAKLTF